eukprot:gene12321-11195_t
MSPATLCNALPARHCTGNNCNRNTNDRATRLSVLQQTCDNCLGKMGTPLGLSNADVVALIGAHSIGIPRNTPFGPQGGRGAINLQGPWVADPVGQFSNDFFVLLRQVQQHMSSGANNFQMYPFEQRFGDWWADRDNSILSGGFRSVPRERGQRSLTGGCATASNDGPGSSAGCAMETRHLMMFDSDVCLATHSTLAQHVTAFGQSNAAFYAAFWQAYRRM